MMSHDDYTTLPPSSSTKLPFKSSNSCPLTICNAGDADAVCRRYAPASPPPRHSLPLALLSACCCYVKMNSSQGQLIHGSSEDEEEEN